MNDSGDSNRSTKVTQWEMDKWYEFENTYASVPYNIFYKF